MTFVVDLETRSEAPLTNGWRYAEHPSTEIICIGAYDSETRRAYMSILADVPPEGDRPAVFWPTDAGPWVPPLADLSVTWGSVHPDILAAARGEIQAWNAHGFERPVWKACGLPEPAQWIDLIDRARRAHPHQPNYKLDTVARNVLGAGKLAEGKKLIELYSCPRADGKLASIPVETLAVFATYCLHDVALEAALAANFQHSDLAPAWELEVERVSGIVNARGFQVDLELARSLLRFAAASTAALERAAQSLGTSTAELRSNDQCRALLARHGVKMPDLQESRVRAMLAHPDLAPAVRKVLMLRLEVERKTATKLGTVLDDSTAAGRMHNQLAYYGAHTGRWAGRGMNPQNLARDFVPSGAAHRFKGDRAAVRAAARAGEGPGALGPILAAGLEPSALIRGLMRSTIVPRDGCKLVLADYSQVEARGVLWVGEAMDELDAFVGGDPYLRLAAELFGLPLSSMSKETHAVERGVGKEVVLACGFGMGPETFEKRMRAVGVDLDAHGLSPAKCINTWRAAYPAIAGEQTEGTSEAGVEFRRGGLWKRIGRAIKDTVGDGQARVAGRVQWSICDGELRGMLPSGRLLRYPNVRIVERVPSWGGDPRPTVVYGPGDGFGLHGAIATENVVQALCRDFLAQAMVDVENERPGLLVFDVHDELVLEVPANEAEDTKAWLVGVMRRPRAWAPDFPLGVEAKVADYFTK